MKPVALGLVIILTAITLDFWAFRHFFAIDYLRWYLAGGALVGFLTSIISRLWGEVDSYDELIAAHPLRYIAACATIAGAPVFHLGTVLRSREPGARSFLDLLVATPVLLIVTLALLAWLAVIAPAQYFVFLICGAPARLARRAATISALVPNTTGGFELTQKPRGAALPPGGKNVDLFAKPVAATALISSGCLLLLRSWLG